MFHTTHRALIVAALATASLTGCLGATSGGGGGPILSGASGGLPGAPCAGGAQNEGCLVQGTQFDRVKCNPTTNVWELVESCASGLVCVEIPGSPNPNVKTTECKDVGGNAGADTTAGDGGAVQDGAGPGGDAAVTDSSVPDTGVTDTGVPDTGVPDAAGPDTTVTDTLGDVAPVCGNGQCEAGETANTCPADCKAGPVCGNGQCEAGETATSCAADCKAGPVCGNGQCEAGETATSCAADCKPSAVCGNGQCETGETATTCAADCAVSKPDSCVGNCDKQAPAGCWCDSQCTGNNDCCADYKSVCSGPACGNGSCESGETSTNCPADCKPSAVCGNGTCEAGELGSCPQDCGGAVCGNGKCETGESQTSCPKDCGTTSDPKSCKGYCGKKAPSGCYCDSQCTQNNDCCGDYKSLCGGGGPVCGDGKCEFGESCPKDCTTSSACPNGKCEAGETEQSCPQDCKKCFGDFTMGSTFYKSNDSSQVGAACSPKGAPKNCPDGYWITFNDNNDCVCVVSCAAFATPKQVGEKCNQSGTWVCKHVTNFKGTSSGKFCVATKWGLCEK